MSDLSNTTILQVSTADTGGGAERVACDLHTEYLRRELDSWLAVGTKHGTDPRTLEISNDRRRMSWTRALTRAAASVGVGSPARRTLSRTLLLASDPARYARIARGAEDYDFPATDGLLSMTPNPPGVLHMHNLHGYYFDLRRLPSLSASQPTILTLHDAWLLTGHCAHPIDCPRWRTGCGECPELDRYVAIRADASAENFHLKRTILSRTTFHLATPSHWLMAMAQESGVAALARSTRVIPNGIDASVFRPGDRHAAREQLGLPPDATLLLFAAKGLADNPFKDWPTLHAALRLLASRTKRKVTLIALGEAGQGELASDADVLSVPFVADPKIVARYYQAANVYVHAARAENLPLAVIEAMACGTPVVASAVGGIPEIVTDGVNGLLVAPGDAAELAKALERLLGDPERGKALADVGLRVVEERFTLTRQVDSYLEYYSELRDAWAAGL